MIYGIRNINKVTEDYNIIRCNNCWTNYYEDITDERNDNSLAFIRDEKTGECFKGCPQCKTDDYLIDIDKTQLAEI